MKPNSTLHSPDSIVGLESSVGIRQLLGFGIGLALGIHDNGSDLLFSLGAVHAVGLDGSDGVYHIHAGSDLAKSSVLAVQMLGILVHDEELGAGGVGALRTGHGQNAALMLQVVLDAVVEKFALDAVAGAAHAGALGAAALDHEARDDTVEDQTVVEIMIAQIDEVVNALGSLLGVQLALNDAAVFHGDLKSRICHSVNISPS